MGATPIPPADQAVNLPWKHALRAWQNRNRLAWKYRRYLLVRALPTVLIVAGYPFAVTLVLGAVPWGLFVVLLVSGSLAAGSAVIIRTYGGSKEIAASRLNIRVYWAVIVVAGVAASFPEIRQELDGTGILTPLYGLATLGLVMLMVSNARIAAEVAAEPEDGSTDAGITPTRLARLATRHHAWVLSSRWRVLAVKWGWAVWSAGFVSVLVFSYRETGTLAERGSWPMLAILTPAMLACVAVMISHQYSQKIIESFSRSTSEES